MELNTVSGEIQSYDFKVTGTSKIKTTSGDVKMYLNGETNCEIKAKSTSGDITFPNGKDVIGKEPYVELNVQTTSGNIKLENKN